MFYAEIVMMPSARHPAPVKPGRRNREALREPRFRGPDKGHFPVALATPLPPGEVILRRMTWKEKMRLADDEHHRMNMGGIMNCTLWTSRPHAYDATMLMSIGLRIKTRLEEEKGQHQQHLELFALSPQEAEAI
ncbi:unnamed protein product [Boreogadus saida]